MIRFALAGLFLICLSPLALADEAKPDFETEAKALEEGYRKAEWAFYEAVRSAKTDPEHPKVQYDWSKHPAKEFAPKFRDLAERAKGTEAACAALIWLLVNGNQPGMQGGEEMAAALQTLASSHTGSARLEAFAGRVAGLQHYAGYEPCADFLEKIMKDSPHRSVRAAATTAMDNLLDSKPGATEEDRDTARALLTSLLKDYADTPAAPRAKGLLFELERLQIGMEAPDFEIRDQDDKAFKLSEYRGKVVVLDFWGFW